MSPAFILIFSVLVVLAIAGVLLFRWRAGRDHDIYLDEVETFYPHNQAIDLSKMVTRRTFQPAILVIEGQGRTHQGFELVEVLGLADNGWVPLVEAQIRATDEWGAYPPLNIEVSIRYVRIGELQYEDGTIVPHNISVWRPTLEDEARARTRIEQADEHVQNVRRRYL